MAIPDIPLIDELPPANESQRWQMFRVKAGEDEHDHLMICVQLADNSFAWVDIMQILGVAGEIANALSDMVRKSESGTQNIEGTLVLGGSIRADGGIIDNLIINSGIINGDNDGSAAWGALVINSPIITDVFGAPDWQGDTGLEIEHINGLEDALAEAGGNAGPHTHPISDITNLQSSLDDKVSKTAGGTQNVAGTISLTGSINASGGIISGLILNSGILNGDNNDTAPWGALVINSPIITDSFGPPEWEGDTGLSVTHINGLEDALDDKADADHSHDTSDVSGLSDALNDKVSKTASGTQSISGSLQLAGSIGATGAIINGGILNGDNNDTMPWGTFIINSPIITDAFGAPEWDGDTGLGIENINGLEDALDQITQALADLDDRVSELESQHGG